MTPSATAARAHLRTLNPEQREAVLHTDGPLLVLAGAGSGKTRMLVHRIVHLIRGEKVDPGRIVAVTFTNKAADEMRERVGGYAGREAGRVVLSTFHSLGVQILRAHGDRLGLPKRFAIYATADQLAALRTACQEISIDDDRFDLQRVLRQISDWKGRRVSPDTARREVAETRARGNRSDDYAVLAADAYPRYQEVLRACGAVDFDDLLLLPLRLLEEEDEVRQQLWRRWRYFMVDEYQDTNGVQLDLVRMLAGPRRNLCVVGDDDQSIYAFRGADVGNILEFERHFPGARIVKLERNYRSTRHILDVANAIIAENPHRHPKRLRTEKGAGELVDYYEHEDHETEAEVVAREIAFRRFRYKRPWREFAILYRTNTQARPLEEALREQNVPYRVVGGTSFFERKEVADGLAYLRLAANPRDEIALRRVINYPTRGIGRTTVLRIAERARTDGIAFADALARVDADDVGAAQARAIDAFRALIDDGRGELRRAEAEARRAPPPSGYPPIARWAERFLDRVGIEDAIRSDPRIAHTADARVDNLRDLVGTLARLERRVWIDRAELEEQRDADGEDATSTATAAAGPPPTDRREASSSSSAGRGSDASIATAAARLDGWAPPTLADLLARVALTPPDDEDDADADLVTLTTLHSAKGLEFDDVFIVGLEEEILPHARAIEAAGENPALDPLAEERRLLYVGVTRARNRLTLSLCRSRLQRGESVPRLPSRYLEAIPESLLNVKSEDRILSAEESAELRENFFSRMKEMLREEGED